MGTELKTGWTRVRKGFRREGAGFGGRSSHSGIDDAAEFKWKGRRVKW